MEGPSVSCDEFMVMLGENKVMAHATLRKGQRAYNLLHTVHPGLANKITARRGVDPFYLDGNIPMFLLFVQEHWDNWAELPDTIV